MSVEEVLKQHCSGLEDEIFQYISGVLESPDDFTSCEDVYDAVGVVLLESMETADEEQIQLICRELYSVLCGSGQIEKTESKRLLDAPVQLTTKLKNEDVSAMNSIWMVQTDSRTVVDQKKLEKADAKLKQKQDKRTSKDADMAATAVRGLSLGGLTTSQALNKQVNRAEASGGVVSDIKIENFDIAYGNHVILSNADLSLVYGRRYGLVGRNGIGKTTLLRSIANRELQLPAHVTILHVEQEVEGDDTLAVDSVLQCDTEREALLQREKELLEKGGPGSPVSPTDTGGSSELSQVYARLHEIDADQAPARAAAILAGLGFSTAMQSRPTSSFSGGWRMRLSLARALFSRPDLLLLDEPTNMLDLKAVMWLEDYLQSWPSTVLLVSHDRTFLSNVCTDIIHVHSQQLTSYKGNYETFVVTKTEKLQHQQKEYEAQMQYRQHLQEFIDRWRYNAKRASQAQMRIKILEKLPELKPVVSEPDVTLRFPDIDKLSPPILQLSEVSFSYSPGKENLVFDRVDISADMDSRIALVRGIPRVASSCQTLGKILKVGENGSGKTTLVKLLTAELTPQDGYRSAHRNLKIAFFSQHHVEQLIMDVSALQLIQSRFPGKKEEEYRHQLGSFGVTGDLALRPICSLSGGQKSRLAFALMFMPRPNFLIFDEPTNHLDVETVEALAKAFKKFKGGVVLVSHDQHLIQTCANEVWVCKDRGVRRLEGGLKQYRTIVQAEFNNSTIRT